MSQLAAAKKNRRGWQAAAVQSNCQAMLAHPWHGNEGRFVTSWILAFFATSRFGRTRKREVFHGS